MTTAPNKQRVSLHKLPEVDIIKPTSRLYNGSFWSWGDKNLYPNTLVDYYMNSPIHNSIIDTKEAYVAGGGMFTDNKEVKLNAFLDKVNNQGDTMQDILDRIIFDFLLYKGYALQVIWNKGQTAISEIYYIPISQLRFTKDKTKLLYCEDWTNSRKEKLEHDLFDASKPVGSQIFYYTGKRNFGLYPVPMYVASLTDIFSNIEISKFQKNTVVSGMFANLYIEFQGERGGEEEEKACEKLFVDKFTGADSSNSIMFGYAEDPARQTRIEAVPNPDVDGKRFLQARENIERSIITAHRISSTALLAIENRGLSFQSEYPAVYAIFNNTFVRPTVEEILKPINKLLSFNFQNPGLDIRPLPGIESAITDQNIITRNMTTEEIRRNLKQFGFIKTTEWKEGTLVKELEQQQNSLDEAFKKIIKSNSNAA